MDNKISDTMAENNNKQTATDFDSKTDLNILTETLSITGMKEEDILEMHSMQEFYSLIYRRVKLKKQIYQAASNRYKILY